MKSQRQSVVSKGDRNRTFLSERKISMSHDIEFSRMTCAACKLPLAYIRSNDLVVCPGCYAWNHSSSMAEGAGLIGGKTDDLELKRRLDVALAEHRLKN